MYFRNICFRPLENARRGGPMLVRGVSGYVKQGNLVCVIGAPDSGATSLLQVLAGRAPRGQLFGELALDGKPKALNSKRDWAQKIAYIPKEDCNAPMLSVRETFHFSADLKLGGNATAAVKKQVVDAALQLLGLDHVADTIVGNQMIRGVSGGEKRRVSIGVEVLSGPRIIIADSPTNGLDSFAALQVIMSAKAMAEAGVSAFVMTIRQPSEKLLQLFDTVCLMSRGTCIYWGSTKEVEPFLNSMNVIRPLRKSLPDFLEEATGDASVFWQRASRNEEKETDTFIDVDDDEFSPRMRRLESQARVAMLNGYRQSKHYRNLGMKMWHELDAALDARIDDEADDPFRELSKFFGITRRFGICHCPESCLNDDGQPVFFTKEKLKNGILWQFFVCLKRQIKLVQRSPTIRARFFRASFQGLLLGTMFYDLPDDFDGANNAFGLLFISCSSVTLASVATIPETFQSRSLFYHQRNAGYFWEVSFFLAVFILEAIVVSVETLIYSLLLYGLCGLNNGLFSWNFLYFWAMTIQMQVTSSTLCQFLVYACPSMVAAQSIAPVFFSTSLLFGGYLLPPSGMPPIFRAMYYYGSVITRPFKALAINELDGRTFHCTKEQLLPPADEKTLHIAPPNGYNGDAYRSCPLSTGKRVLSLYEMDQGMQNKFAIYVENLVYMIVFFLLTLWAMNYIDYSLDYSADTAAIGGEGEGKQSRRTRNRDDENEEERKSEKMMKNGTKKRDSRSSVDDIEETKSSKSIVPIKTKENTNKQRGCIEFRKLRYTVLAPRGKLTLLTDVDGFAMPGQMVALMGPSGAGKTTLLDVLADKKTGGTVTGTILVGNSPRDVKRFPRIAGYVEQMDSHLPTQSVREAVMMSALLRLPSRVSRREKKRRVELVLGQLNLLDCGDELIGMAGSGINGVSPEVRKKVTIAVELVMDPSLLFLDEPTTGLDSASAFAVLSSVRSVCENKAVLCTIHQPALELFNMFNSILLLQKGGRVAYFGEVAKMIDYFKSNGFREIVEGQNPADYALECAGGSGLDGNFSAADVWDASDMKKEHLDGAPSLLFEPSDGSTKLFPVYAAGDIQQFLVCLRVQTNYLWRDSTNIKMRFILPIIFSCLVGSIFFQLGDDQVGAKSRVSVMFISVIFSSNISQVCIPKVIMERPVLFRERGSNSFRILPYFLAVVCADIPVLLLSSILYIVPLYVLVGLEADMHVFLLFSLCFILINACNMGWCHLITVLSPNADSATIIQAVSGSVFSLFAGFMLPYKSIPSYWKWLYAVDIARRPLQFFVVNEMRSKQFNCGNDTSLAAPYGTVGAIPIFIGGKNSTSPPPPFGLGDYSSKCGFGKIPNINAIKNMENESCWRLYCPVTSGNARFSNQLQNKLKIMIHFLIYKASKAHSL
eukprot:g482.t1